MAGKTAPDFTAFARELIRETVFEGRCPDGMDIETLALKHNIVREAPYDPKRHGPWAAQFDIEPGQEICEFTPVPPEQYLIWSDEHRAWWRPNHRGYTNKLSDAGRYSRDEAIAICKKAFVPGNKLPGFRTPPEFPVREGDALAFVEECN